MEWEDPGSISASCLVSLLDLQNGSPSGPQMTLTFCFDSQGCPDQGKQGGIEHDCPITVQRHVHGDQALEGEEEAKLVIIANSSRRTYGATRAGECWEGALKLVCMCQEQEGV